MRDSSVALLPQHDNYAGVFKTLLINIRDIQVTHLTDHKSEQREHWHSPEVILGINDGLIETLGFVTGVFGATAAGKIIIITGMAQIIAGSISMAVGAYVSQKAFKEFYDREEEIEKREMEAKPEEERDEVEAIYKKKGFKGDELKTAVHRITSDKKVWLDTMMVQEL